MGTDFLSGSGLQSGFVLAVIIAAVLLANHLGGGTGLARRAAQVALGLALMMLVFSATTAFHGAPDVPIDRMESIFEADGPEEFLEASRDSAARSSQVGTIHIGLGIIFVALGVVVFRKLGGLTPGLLLGGVFLMLLGTAEGGGDPANPLNALTGLLGAALPGSFSDAGTAQEIARFAVLAVGTLLLAALLCCWDRKVGAAASSGEVEESEDS